MPGSIGPAGTARRVVSDAADSGPIQICLRGARPSALAHYYRLTEFQSARPRGARLFRVGDPGEAPSVSMHAPARGATTTPTSTGRTRRGFNPRACEGRDSLLAPLSVTSQIFQSTRPRGARLSPMVLGKPFVSFQSTRPRRARRGGAAPACRYGCFNPRAREGRDQAHQRLAQQCDLVSIHAPARGATLTNPIYIGQQIWFQSTRPRGARPPSAAMSKPTCSSFNLRAREGRDRR